jgi:riboflavin synthase
MFTGIIECLGHLEKIEKENSNLHFTFSSPISHLLKVDQSVSHNGVCLTVVGLGSNTHTVTAIDETLQKTNLIQWQQGQTVNLERCMAADGRFDGHIVQGHVDTTATCSNIQNLNGSWVFDFEHHIGKNFITVEKGSIAVNGVSLTVVNAHPGGFSVCIIPYTFDNTCFQSLQVGQQVNLEFDIIGKYVSRMLQSAGL